MKRILKIIRNIFLVLLTFLLGVLLFLITYYLIQNNRLKNRDSELLQNSQIRLIQADSIGITANLPLKLLPVPQKAEIREGYYQVPEYPTYTAIDSIKDDIDAVLRKFPELGVTYSNKPGDITISYRNDLKPEGYNMDIQPGRINIEYTDIRGLYYAFVTLKVLDRNHNGLLPCALIEDYPDLPVRGLMLDISRDKVPLSGTLTQIAGLLADLKYNHFELYIEGFSFAYPSFRHLWENNETPVTGEEIQALDSFCRANFIELVPNQNSFGHMMAWLATEEYADLAECPDGYRLLGLIKTKSTLDPSDPRSIELITTMTDDLLPNFSSGKFNVNLDEPFELGQGKSKRLIKKKGVGEVYLDYTLKIHELAVSRKKEMLMWADIILRHPEIIKELPRDITLLDWGYEANYPFERNCRILQQSGVKFMVCAGTSSWTSIAGRTNNMLGNIASAAANAVKYGAQGMLVTDWGDMGHWQYLPVSYGGYATGGALSWNSKSMSVLPLTSFMNSYIFRDTRQIMGDLALDLGRYMQYEELPVPNMTTTMLSLQFGLNDRLMNNALFGKLGHEISELMKEVAPEMVDSYLERIESGRSFDFTGLFTFLDEKEALLNSVSLIAEDGQVIIDEYRNAIRLLRIGGNLQYYIERRDNLSLQERRDVLQNISSWLNQYLDENRRLWIIRNKPGGYERSTAVLNKLLHQIDEQIVMLEEPALKRGLDRFTAMITAAVATLYLKVV